MVGLINSTEAQNLCGKLMELQYLKNIDSSIRLEASRGKEQINIYIESEKIAHYCIKKLKNNGFGIKLINAYNFTISW